MDNKTKHNIGISHETWQMFLRHYSKMSAFSKTFCLSSHFVPLCPKLQPTCRHLYHLASLLPITLMPAS